MASLSKIKSHSDVMNYFTELPFYNKPTEKPVKRLKKIDPLVELPFYEQLNVIKTNFKLEKSFEEILDMIDVWINKDLAGLLN